MALKSLKSIQKDKKRLKDGKTVPKDEKRSKDYPKDYRDPPIRMTTPARRRLLKVDFKRLQNDPPEGISGAPMENDLMKWTCVIFGLMPYSIVKT